MENGDGTAFVANPHILFFGAFATKKKKLVSSGLFVRM
jgi:hypothetical protein